MNKYIAKNYNSLIVVIFILGCFLRFYGFNTQGYWFDEWTTLWHANPAFDWNNFYNLRREFAQIVMSMKVRQNYTFFS
jgi:hypothetical protein